MTIEEYTNVMQLYKQLLKETDRGAALSTAAFIDDSLGELFMNYLADVPEKKELLYGFAAPLSSLAAKSKLALAAGLLSKEIFDAINIFRSIRNDFAHTWQELTFESENISQKIGTLPDHYSIQGVKLADLRSRFIYYAALVIFELHMYKRKVIKNVVLAPVKITVDITGPFPDE
jgi:mannitol operon repressor